MQVRLSRVQKSRQISPAGLCALVPRAGSRNKQQEHGELGHGAVISSKISGRWEAEMGTCGKHESYLLGTRVGRKKVKVPVQKLAPKLAGNHWPRDIGSLQQLMYSITSWFYASDAD